MPHAEHEETCPEGDTLVVTKLYCSLKEQEQSVQILRETLAFGAYQQESAAEKFMCNYGLNPDYRYVLIREPLRMSGIGPDGEARIVELHDHPFYVVTLFVPQLTSTADRPHPLIVEFVRASSY